MSVDSSHDGKIIYSDETPGEYATDNQSRIGASRSGNNFTTPIADSGNGSPCEGGKLNQRDGEDRDHDDNNTKVPDKTCCVVL